MSRPARASDPMDSRRSRSRPCWRSALWAVVSVSVDRPVAYDAITEQFKYGSIGSEPGVSLLRPVGGVLPPYWIFRALPEICRDKLPGGYASLGFVVEPGRELPIGVSRRRRLGIDQAGLNCAVCHTGTVREAPGAPPRIVLGMPAHQIDLQSFVEFVLDCTLDNRLTADSIRGRFPGDEGPAAMERLLLRAGLVDRLKIATLELKNRISPILGDRVPRWGRGRVDTFNPYKAIQFNWPLEQLPAGRASRRLRLSVALEPEAARGHAPALGRRQRFGGRAEPERVTRCGRHAGHCRSRRPPAHPQLDLDAARACRTRS